MSVAYWKETKKGFSGTKAIFKKEWKTGYCTKWRKLKMSKYEKKIFFFTYLNLQIPLKRDLLKSGVKKINKIQMKGDNYEIPISSAFFKWPKSCLVSINSCYLMCL